MVFKRISGTAVTTVERSIDVLDLKVGCLVVVNGKDNVAVSMAFIPGIRLAGSVFEPIPLPKDGPVTED